MRNLLDFLKTYHHWFIFIFLEIASGVLLFQYNSYHGSVWLSSSNVVVGKIYEWESALLAYTTYGKANEELTLRNYYLERQNDQLRRLYQEAIKDTSALERQELAFLSQFNPIPAKVVDNFDFDENEWEDDEVRGKGKNVLRSRLQLEWDIPKCKFDPFASVEFHTTRELEKTRFILGVNHTLKKKHSFKLYYRYQLSGSSIDEPNIHMLGLGYTYKF